MDSEHWDEAVLINELLRIENETKSGMYYGRLKFDVVLHWSCTNCLRSARLQLIEDNEWMNEWIN